MDLFNKTEHTKSLHQTHKKKNNVRKKQTLKKIKSGWDSTSHLNTKKKKRN